MSRTKRKPLLNRKETQTLLTTLKVASTAGALSLTLAGWGLLAHLEAGTAQANSNQPVVIAASAESKSNIGLAPKLTPTPAPTAQKTIKLDIVQWVRDVQGNAIAVVRDRRGSLWYVMGSDVPRLEQGLSPRVRPQLVQMVAARTRAS